MAANSITQQMADTRICEKKMDRPQPLITKQQRLNNITPKLFKILYNLREMKSTYRRPLEFEEGMAICNDINKLRSNIHNIIRNLEDIVI
jgi:c-di-AMP phosphodiesterase-like protein